jgi:CheY-like chemotaxis protein
VTGRPRALVVDDEDDVRALVSVVLGNADFDVRTAVSGVAALELLATDPLPHLVVLDVQMPDLDGWDTLAAIRGDPRTAGVAVMLCTVRAQPRDDERARSLGCDAYIRKPFAIDVLAAEAHAVVRRRTGEDGG